MKPLPLVRVQDLEHTFTIRHAGSGVKNEIHALKGVSFEIQRGETLGIVGESGSGKSTLGRCLLNLIHASQGEVFFEHLSLRQLSFSQMKPLRRRMQIIFQDPFSSLNPRMTVEDLLEEPLWIHGLFPRSQERSQRVAKLLDLVGLSLDTLRKYPHEFSGGQRQRISIARALAVQPEFVVCDEPVSALDVSIQAQILNLLLDLQKELNLTYLFISHDLRVIQYMCHRVLVMCTGRIVESGYVEGVFSSPQNVYTKDLISAIPKL